MPKLFCKECGGQTLFDGVKPSFCSFCSEPFVKKPATASSPPATKQATGQRSIAERVQHMEDVQEEIPSSFDVRAEGSTIGIAGQRIIVDDKFIKSMPSFDRGGASGEGTGDAVADRQLSQAKQEALKRLLDPSKVR